MRRFLFKTPKGLLTLVLATLIVIGAWQAGPLGPLGLMTVASQLWPAIVGAAALDAAILRFRHPRWEFPSGAILTAMIVGMVLSGLTPWYVVLATSLAGVGAKYILRTRGANVFNPAALGIVALFPIFHSAQNWWGALPEAHPVAQLALPAGGVFIAYRVNKLPLVIAFLGIYFTLFTVAAFVRDPAWVSEVFRTPDVQAALYFAFFILTDPPTSPIVARDQVIFAAIAALASFVIFESTGAVYYLLAGVLAGNVWEARRRVVFRSRRRSVS